MNPVNSMADNGQRVGVSPANPINDPSFSSRQGSNTFDLSFQNLLTCRYGEITPFFYMSGLGRDRLELRSSHELRTYTLGAPLMSGLRMRKSTFSVSKKAMMPNSFNYLFVNPVKGNDVPDDAYCFIDIIPLLTQLKNIIVDKTKLVPLRLKCFVLFNQIASAGSLMDLLGISIHGGVYFGSNMESSLDEFTDSFLPLIVGKKGSLTYNLSNPADNTEQLETYTLDESSTLSDVVEFFGLIAQHPDCQIEFMDESFVDTLYNAFMDVKFGPSSLVVNLYKVVAYQMIVSQFYTNDHVDNVYNSDLWLSNQTSLAYAVIGDAVRSFDYNGVPIYYDVYSNHCLSRIINALERGTTYTDNALYFFFNTFAFRRSLRYGDYFLSSRPMPLAVGDVTVPVVGSGVNILDINKNLHVQRFLNAVNRVGSDLVSYAKGIFGYTPQEDDARPRFISSEVVYVGSDEIDNTAQNQGQVNVNMIAQQSNYMFDVEITDECIVLGLLSFECTGAYDNSIERDNFHKTRFDSFIPELQHIGDQSVYSLERNVAAVPAGGHAFGYQVRYAEYKFKYNQMHGAFCTPALRNWAFPVDVVSTAFLNEDAIRSSPKEFDRYYKSLTYASLANRFHFQISFANNVRANRAMDYQPNLLG